MLKSSSSVIVLDTSAPSVIMGKDDYSSTGGGLKLKGSKPSGVEKKRKKKVPASTTTTVIKETSQEKPDTASTLQAALLEEHETMSREVSKTDEDADSKRNELDEIHKTEAERRHEEMRRKRLNDRLKKEGLKTHKERVEELNKYLSGLSEHHDMYVLLCCCKSRHYADGFLGRELDLAKTYCGCAMLSMLVTKA